MRMKALFSALLVLACAASSVGAQSSTSANKPRTVAGFAPDRLARIDQLLQRAVDDNEIAGSVGLVLRDGRVVYERAVGWSDKEAGRRMTTDAIFRIASQSKALTSTAILMLIEEGRLGLGDPVSKYIPQFAHTTVASRSDTGRVIVPAKRAITIEDLLTHTSGISYGTDSIVAPLYAAKGLGPAAGWGWYTADKTEPICTTIERLATVPFVAQPGEAWVYGYNTDVLGCVVERASGVAPRGQGDYVDGPRRSFSGGAGLLSTAHDYARFLQMLLNGGELDGVRLLSPRTIELMTTNQVGTKIPWVPGAGFGLAFGTTDRLGADGMASVGSYGWGGAYGSMYKVDPSQHLVMVFMIQQLPNKSQVASRFPTLVYQALVEPNK